MSDSARVLRSFAVTTAYLATAVVTACSPGGSDGSDGAGAERSAGGRAGASTRIPAGGSGAGGANASVTGGGGGLGTGGSGEAGSPFDGQAGKGGGLEIAGGGSGSGGGGRSGAGGSGGRSGAGGTGGSGSGGKAGSGAGGKAGSGGAGAPGDACAVTTAPTGGTEHKTSNATGKAAGMDWALWSNGSGGSITTYDVPAFSAAWNNSGDFLARLGLQWNASKTYDQYGTITAQFAYKKTGTGGGYSYIGMYGWSVSPCVEWYIVDDSYNKMPVNPGSTTNKGTADIDGGKYTLYTRSTTGTGGSKCSGTTNWLQFYSIRQTARQCGQISVTAHFAAWAAAGMTLGKMDQAQILVEVGGGTGTVDFTVASVVAQ